MKPRVRTKAKVDTRGPLARLLDAERLAESQGVINVLTDTQLAMMISPLAFSRLPDPQNEGERLARMKEREAQVLDVYGKERAVFAAENKGRRFYRLQHLDRLHKNQKLTYEQHQAGKWYRDRWEAGQYDRPASTDYSRPRGESIGDFTPLDRQQRARDEWRRARCEWPKDMVGFMDRFLLRDHFPRLHHRAAARQLSDIRRALDAMAKYLRLA